MQMILEGRVDRLENLMAEVIELCRELKTDAAERDRVFSEHIRQEKEEMDAFRQEMAAIKLDAVERDRKFEE
ncbi:hypothetical protein MBAV_003094 [Candidatus Magnetobacterium bavaricum]|uniref:Uncharacterized protein n=1 Tax=Candidatus Magnetobacterium bavaricum TaxID=29290 RepID=A0A0F3GSA2_9BACT|nr:hypothetical protein MBAV_003094 [Candidatus Magnetobacterium bavaricum]